MHLICKISFNARLTTPSDKEIAIFPALVSYEEFHGGLYLFTHQESNIGHNSFKDIGLRVVEYVVQNGEVNHKNTRSGCTDLM